MSTSITLEGLFRQIEAMQACLARDDAVATGQLLLLHDHDLREFLADPDSVVGGPDVLGHLLAAQRAVIDVLVAAREGARSELQASRRNDRASRAYLANVEH